LIEQCDRNIVLIYRCVVVIVVVLLCGEKCLSFESWP
jgi:hypothetical protein